MVVYICEQGAKIQREGERLLVNTKGSQKTIFIHQLEQLVLLGNVHLTAQARTLLLARHIDVLFLSSQGKYRGRLITLESENVFLRKRQYELLADATFQLKIARAIVSAKIHNQRIMLGRLRKNHGLEELGEGIAHLRLCEQQCLETDSVDSLRGVEGEAAAAYFRHFARGFHTDWGFGHRTRRPPTDPVNAVLSLCYTLLVDRCHTACRLAALDPYPAHLHSLEYGRHSLPLDLVEEFRAMFADALTLSLFNQHMLKKDDFLQAGAEAAVPEEETPPGAPRLLLAQDALKRVLQAFSRKLATEFRYQDQTLSYEEAIRHQALAYRKCVAGEVDAYEPVRWH